ncbi:MAG: FMN-binding protein [Candidatus Omnitrophota bacterium]
MKSFLRYAIIVPAVYAAIAAFTPVYGADREIKACADGYRGPINMLITIDSEDKIAKIRILGHNETEGIGARVCEQDFLNQFEGKTADEVIARKGVDAITGATISSGAVIEAAGIAVKVYLSRHPSKLRDEKNMRQ